MTTHRFFVPADAMLGDRFPVPSSIERQVRGVLRLRDGARVVLLNGDGMEAECVLEGTDCVIVVRRANRAEPTHRLTVAQALLKGDALEDVIQHGTEVGIAAFQLVLAERCVAREISDRRLDRLRSIAREAAEQSERGIIPAVDAPVPVAKVMSSGAVLLHERAGEDGLAGLDPPATVIIGPEGGWTDAEVTSARAAGVPVVGLGPRILRSQTVAVAAGAVILSRAGDFA